jgi:transcriptional regulator with XRE-family HTH domain
MSEAERAIGAFIGALRAQQEIPLETLAQRTGLPVARLAAIENGFESFTVGELERIASAYGLPLRTLVGALQDPGGPAAPLANRAHFRPQVPLPEGLSLAHLEAAMNHTQLVIHKMNRNMQAEAGTPLQGLIQGNNFSGLVSNVLSNSMDRCTSYKHNHHQRYPDLINPDANGGTAEGLEIKTTIQVRKGGESHNGHSGWHLIACYRFTDTGDIQFIHLMIANLNSHLHPDADWTYVGSQTNAITGSRRTETFNTTGKGTTKLRDGTVFLDPNFVNFSRWKQERHGPCPSWSIFYQGTATEALRLL